MKVNDAIAGAIFIALAGFVFVYTQGFRVMPGQNYGAGFFPRAIAGAMALCGLALVVQGVRQRAGAAWAEAFDWMRSPAHVVNAVAVLAAMLFYILCSDFLGFAITAMAALFALLLILRGWRHGLSSAAIALAATVVIAQFFGQFLRVPLPPGLFALNLW